MSVDLKISALITTATWSGALMAGFGALALAEWLAVGGFLLALGGFVFNVIHKTRMDRLAREKFEWEKMHDLQTREKEP